MKFKKFKFKIVRSTNNTAIRIIKKTHCEYGMVISESQTNGKGQYGRKWISNKGNLFVTFFHEVNKIKLSIATIPKLNYERVYEIKKENPDIEVIINGGITNIEDIKKHLIICDGVMIGRAIYQNPYFLSDIEKEIFNTDKIPSREDIAKKILKYLEEEVKLGTKVNHIMRHTVGLYHGQPGSKDWKRYLSDNMMARDSDFQKAKHIMTIVQNNEKANQINS